MSILQSCFVILCYQKLLVIAPDKPSVKCSRAEFYVCTAHQIHRTQIYLTNEPSSALTDKNQLRRTIFQHARKLFMCIQLHKVSSEQLQSRGNINVKPLNFTMCEQRMNEKTTVVKIPLKVICTN